MSDHIDGSVKTKLWEKAWSKGQARTIHNAARTRYGPGWHLMSADAQRNFIEAQVLSMILAQQDVSYAPAQLMARLMLTQFTNWERR